MRKPKLYTFNPPKSLEDYPQFPTFQAGHLVSTNKSYRTLAPSVNEEACTGCLICYASCPDGAIFRLEKIIKIDYDFCKGCGICAKECKSGVIHMEKEQQ